MKKRLLCIFCTAMMILSSFTSALAFTAWESPRYIPSDEYKTPWTVEGNPYYTYYAPWLRQLHLMTATEAENNKAAGITGGEACQQIRQLAISPLDSNIMYLCSDTSGVYKTTNGGKHWYNTTNNAAGHDAKGLLCDKFDKDTVYVYMRKVGVHRSRDGGYTWEQIVEDTDPQELNLACGEDLRRSNTIAQDEDGNTYMAVGSGIYKLDREDNLTNLTATQYPDMAKYTGKNGVVFLDLDVSPNGKVIYAAAVPRKDNPNYLAGLYVSVDSGNIWEVYNANGTQTYEHIMTVAIDPADPTGETIYAGLEVISDTSTDEAEKYSLYKSENAGKTYTKVWGPYGAYNLEGNYLYKYFYGLTFGPKNAQGEYPLYLHLQSTNWPLRVIDDYRSANPTDSKVYDEKDYIDADTIRAGYTGSDYQAFAPDMNIPGRVVFTSSGVYEKSSDGKFKRITSGYSGAALRDIVFDSDNEKMIAPAVDTGLYIADTAYTKDNTTPTFDKNTTRLYATRALIDPNNDNHVFVFSGSSNGGEYRRIQESTDGGKNFTVETATDAVLNTDAGEINATVLCYDKDNKKTIYSSYHNSYDNGVTWEENDYFILDVHPDNSKLQVGIKGTDKTTELYKTIDGGENWTYVTTLDFNRSHFITDADFDRNNENYIWIINDRASTANAFIRVNLEDGTWRDYTSEFDYYAFRQIEINPNDFNHILVATYPGRNADRMMYDFKLAESYDGGETWHTVPGLWGGDFNNIIFSPTTDEAFIVGLSGTFIYDYKKLNYHQAMRFTYNGQSVIKELLRVNDERKNVNNGEYIIAPEDLFKPENKRFTGWDIGGKIYMPDELVPLSELKNIE